MKAAIVIMFLATMTVAKHHHRNLRKTFEAKDFFIKISEDIHGLMEKIFDSINLNDNFTKEPNVKKLLTMHYDLSNIAEKNIESLYDVQNASQVSKINQTEDRIRLDNAVEQILKEMNIGVYEQIKGKKHKHNHEKHKIKIESKTDTSVIGTSEELMDFVMEFLDQENNATEQDLKKSTKRRNKSYRRNLKVWEPPPNIKIHINAKTRRVFNGMKTTVKKFPFIVSIHILGEFACAGSIISRDVVISAATCLQEAYSNHSRLNPKSIYVRLGSDYTDSDGETIPVHELYFHPNFEPEVLKNNLVLIRLEKRIRFSKEQNKIRRILYDTADRGLDPGEEGVLILGWGSTVENQVVNRNQKLSLDMLDLYNWDSCKNLYSENYVNRENFCGGMADKRGGACNGDVGGPGVVGAVLMGIISFGAPACGSSDTPTVFIKLGYYADWIESVLKPKPERRQSMIWRDLFARRNIDPIDIKRIYHSKSSKKKFRVGDDYPEEVSVLREILSELVKSNTDMVDELLYGDLYEDFNDIFISKEKLEVLQDALVNKSLHPIPEVHYGSDREYVTEILTRSPTPPMTDIIDTLSTPKLSVTHLLGSTQDVPIPMQDLLRNRPQRAESEPSSNYYTDNYEGSSNERGMSIEVFTTTDEVPTNKKVAKHHKKKKIKAKTTTVTTKNRHKEKRKHHKKTTASKVLIATEMIPYSDETAHNEKHRPDKIDETKAVALKPLETYADEIKVDSILRDDRNIKKDRMEDIKQFIQEDNYANYKLSNREEANVYDYYYLANNEKNPIADNMNPTTTENIDKYKDYYYDNNKIADNLNIKVIGENNDDNYKDDNIITGSKNDKVLVLSKENIIVTDNVVNIISDKQINKTDYNKDEIQKTNANNNVNYDEHDNKPALLVTEEEKKYSIKKKNVENLNDQKQDNEEKQRSDEYSFTPYTPFFGTHMDVEYATVGLKVKKKHLKGTKTKAITEVKSPNFHAMPKYSQPSEGPKMWEAFFNMKLMPT